MKQLLTINLGRTRYADAWELQKKIFSARLEKKIPDVLLLTEHDPVFTLGKGADTNHLLASDEELHEKKIDMFHIDRGGDVTFHGPGQIVGYPILDLNNYYCDIHRYLRDLEEVLIQTLSEYEVQAMRSEGLTGVWVKNEKIAAIGVKVSRWITMHGFALNVNTDLQYFERMIPCGIFDKGVTSLYTIVEKKYSLQDVEQTLIRKFETVFSVESKQVSIEDFLTILPQEEIVV